MALSRLQTEFTYKSVSGSQIYYFSVTMDESGGFALRNIQGPNGLIQDQFTSLPEIVMDDIQSALTLSKDLVGETLIAQGTVTFNSETSKTVTLGPSLQTANYRVALTPDPGGIVVAAENLTVDDFDIVTSITYSGDIAYEVLYSTVSNAATSGTTTLTSAANYVDITFSDALNSSAYHVVLTPDGFYPVEVQNKKKSGFRIQMGISLTGAETATVGYDVFV
jgi:hypothetical protein